jgi:hypothetical protein
MAQLRIVLGLSGEESDVLVESHLPRPERFDGTGQLRTPRGKVDTRNLTPEPLGQELRNRSKGGRRIPLSVRPPQVGDEENPPPLLL